MRIFLSGPMGAGKSSIGKRLAVKRGIPFHDLDQLVAEAAGRSVSEIFHQDGETAFRQMEREALAKLLATPGEGVVALGGGSVTNPITRGELLQSGWLITLWASVEELARRIAAEHGRPLLAGRDAKDALREILSARQDAYAECHARVHTDGLPADVIVDRIGESIARTPILVPLGRRSYAVRVGCGVRDELDEAVERVAGDRRALLVVDANVENMWGDRLFGESLAAKMGRGEVFKMILQGGEQAKTLAAAEAVWNAALAAGIDRDGIVIAVGGGVVGDVAGFAAATLLRGVAFAQMPTTVLAMVDSSVGGKTGINRREGKNLVGAFHQPRFVICDVDLLSTLEERERRAGLAEVAKSAWLDGEDGVRFLEAHAAELRDGAVAPTIEAIRRAVLLKARIVARDERETGERRLLNLGHTIGHALEVATGYTRFLHGEAVALGLVTAFRMAAAWEGAGRPGASSSGREGAVAAAGERLLRMTKLLAALGLPVKVDAALDAAVLGHLARDKKRSGALLHFVMPQAPGETAMVPLPVAEIGRLLSA